MPLTTPDFSSTQSLASPNLITFNDTSIGSDGTITVRKIEIRLANGNWLTTAGESTTQAFQTWNYSDTSIQLNLLSRSTTASVTVGWYVGAATVPLYTKTEVMEWDLQDFLFLFELLQTQTSDPNILQDADYYSNFIKMIVNLFNSENATDPMDDLYSSQGALDKNYYMIQNESIFF